MAATSAGPHRTKRQTLLWSVVAGIVAALVIATIPPALLEAVIGATGLSEFVPAAAPPLGNTARMLLALFAGLVAAGIVFFITNRTPSDTAQENPDMGVALREKLNAASPPQADYDLPERKKSRGFALPKFDAKSLTRFLRKPKKSGAGDGNGVGEKARITDLADLPRLRDSDTHPDAPPRKPIMAGADLGAPLPPAEEAPDLAPPVNPFAARPRDENVDADASSGSHGDIVPETVEVSAAQPVGHSETQAPVPSETVSAEPTRATTSEGPTPSGEELLALSVDELADRLELGLARLRELAGGAAQPAPRPADADVPEQAAIQDTVPERPSAPPLQAVEPTEEEQRATAEKERAADMDAALKAALGTLERMTVNR